MKGCISETGWHRSTGTTRYRIRGTDAWDGVRDATLSGPMGIHVNRDGVLTGVEDCLNMDIYRPDTQQTGRIRWISRSSLMQQTSSLSA